MLLVSACRTTPARGFFEPGSLALVPMAGAVSYDSNGHSGVAPSGTLKVDWKPWSADHPAGLNGEAALGVARLMPGSETKTGENYSFRIGPLWAFSPLYGITPIVTASFGLLYGDSDPGTKSTFNPFYAFGGGVSYPVTSRLALRAEVIRFQTLDVAVARGYEFAVGLSYHFQTSPPVTEHREVSAAGELTGPRAGARPRVAAGESDTRPAESTGKQDSGKQDSGKQDSGKQDSGKQDSGKQADSRMLNVISKRLSDGNAGASATKPVAGTPPEGGPAKGSAHAKPAAVAEAPRRSPGTPPALPIQGGTAVDRKSDETRSRSFPANAGEPSLACLSGVRAVEVLEFRPGSQEVPPSLRPQLKKAAELVRTDPALRIRIAAHTDASGNVHANYRLSNLRARRIKEYLVHELGADPRSITAKGYGHYQPVAGNETAAGRELNRRAVVIVQEK